MNKKEIKKVHDITPPENNCPFCRGEKLPDYSNSYRAKELLDKHQFHNAQPEEHCSICLANYPAGKNHYCDPLMKELNLMHTLQKLQKQKDQEVTEPTPPHNEWEKDIRLVKERSDKTKSGWQVVYDPEALINQISKLLEEAEIRENALMYAKQVVESDKAYERGKKEGYEKSVEEVKTVGGWTKTIKDMMAAARKEELSRIKSLIEGMDRDWYRIEIGRTQDEIISHRVLKSIMTHLSNE